MKKYTITLTEEQMRLIAEGIEDYHRFLASECRALQAVPYLLWKLQREMVQRPKEIQSPTLTCEEQGPLIKIEEV